MQTLKYQGNYFCVFTNYLYDLYYILHVVSSKNSDPNRNT